MLSSYTRGAAAHSGQTHGRSAAVSAARFVARRPLVAVSAAIAAFAAPASAVAAPAAPTNLAVKATSLHSVALAWAPSSSYVKTYTVFRDSGAGPQLVATLRSQARSYLDAGRPLGSTASYTVKANDSSGASAPSNQVTGATTTSVTVLTGCSATAQPAGHYALSASGSFTASGSGPCLKFSSGTNTSLDCNNKAVTVSPSSPAGIEVYGVGGSIISDCKITSSAPTNGNGLAIQFSTNAYVHHTTMENAGTAKLSSAGFADLSDNTFTSTSVSVSSSNSPALRDNSLSDGGMTVTTGTAASVTGNHLDHGSLVVSGSTGADVSQNTANLKWAYGDNAIQVHDSSGATVDGNTVTDAALQVYRSPHADISDNTLTADPAKNLTLQLVIGRWQLLSTPGYTPDELGSGDYVTVANNHVTGGWEWAVDSDGNPILGDDGAQRKFGIDDNILILGPVSHFTVVGNTTDGSYDAGIETGNVVTDSVFYGNHIANAGLYGIGAYWRTAWERNTVSHNTVNVAPALFKVDTEDETGSIYDSVGGYPTGRDEFSIVGNSFTDNTLLNATDPSGPAAVLGRRTDVVPSRPNGEVHDNIVARNDFGYTAQSPLFVPDPGMPATSTVDVAQSVSNHCNAPTAPQPVVIQCIAAN